ncbi:MAG: hypothetical protein H6739_30285 [Alphaproteobacteria bacterium]|nr:hypothetical protein [Alphaproteobacteria bacterium]
MRDDKRLVYILDNKATPEEPVSEVFARVEQTIRELESAFFNHDVDVKPEETEAERPDAISQVMALRHAIQELSVREAAMLCVACGLHLASEVTGDQPELEQLRQLDGLSMAFTSEFSAINAEGREQPEGAVKVYTLVKARPDTDRQELPVIAVELIREGEQTALTAYTDQSYKG